MVLLGEPAFSVALAPEALAALRRIDDKFEGE
jgi:hypothetical protein